MSSSTGLTPWIICLHFSFVFVFLFLFVVVVWQKFYDPHFVVLFCYRFHFLQQFSAKALDDLTFNDTAISNRHFCSVNCLFVAVFAVALPSTATILNFNRTVACVTTLLLLFLLMLDKRKYHLLIHSFILVLYLFLSRFNFYFYFDVKFMHLERVVLVTSIKISTAFAKIEIIVNFYSFLSFSLFSHLHISKCIHDCSAFFNNEWWPNKTSRVSLNNNEMIFR